MAAFSDYPSPYTSVKQSAILTLTAETGSVIEVEINGYYKQLSSLTRTVNIAPYFKEDFDIQPLDKAPSSYTIVDAKDYGRVVYASASVDGEESTPVALSFADNTLVSECFLTGIKQREVVLGGTDELSIYATKSLRVEFDNGSVSGSTIAAGLYSAQFKPSYFANVGEVLHVSLYDGDTLLDRIKYTVVGYADVQLAWVNSYGVIDTAIFSEVTSQTEVTKEALYLGSGYINVDVVAEDTTTVTTAALPRATIKSLSYILRSSGVWRKLSGAWSPIDITSDSATMYDVDNLSVITVEFRDKVRT
ncbi:MAG: hypothetical protein SNG69_07180 [Rikenellaceae bacterium]